MTPMRLTCGKSTVAETRSPATRDVETHAGPILLCWRRPGGAPSPWGRRGRRLFLFVRLRAAHNPRLLEIIVGGGNDCAGPGVVALKQAGDIRPVSDVISGRGREPSDPGPALGPLWGLTSC